MALLDGPARYVDPCSLLNDYRAGAFGFILPHYSRKGDDAKTIDINDLMTVAQVAKRSPLSEPAIRNRVNIGQLKAP